MSLSPPAARRHLHTRSYNFEGFEREDGLWDVEGRIADTKSYGFDNAWRGHIAAGEPIHDMSVRLTVDLDLVVRDIEATTGASPYRICPDAAPGYKRMIGARIGPGWRRTIKERLGGVAGCTHISEMLGAMATVVYQTLYPALARREEAKSETAGASKRKPPLLDSCYGFRSDGEVVKRLWPDFYTGEE